MVICLLVVFLFPQYSVHTCEPRHPVSLAWRLSKRLGIVLTSPDVGCVRKVEKLKFVINLFWNKENNRNSGLIESLF